MVPEGQMYTDGPLCSCTKRLRVSHAECLIKMIVINLDGRGLCCISRGVLLDVPNNNNNKILLSRVAAPVWVGRPAAVVTRTNNIGSNYNYCTRHFCPPIPSNKPVPRGCTSRVLQRSAHIFVS